MPRKAREKSSTGIYAILLEGERELFRDDEDYNEFIERIDDYLDVFAIAFALTEKAICLIVKESERGIGMDIKPITTSYARYYGSRYESEGGIFKQRFKSSPIETADDMAWNLACIHKLCETLEVEGYTGRYDGDELFIPESAMALMGERAKYDELMSEEKVLTEFFAVLSPDKPDKPKKAPVKRTTAKPAAKKTAKKPVKKVEEKPVVKEIAVKEVKAAPVEEVKPVKKKKMPTWLL